MDTTTNGSAASREHFQNKAAEYERASGGSTSSIARHLATLAGHIDEESHILDVAAGPGVVIDELLKFEQTQEGAKSARYCIVEPAESMLEIVRYKASSKWLIDADRIATHNLSAEDLEDETIFPSDAFTHVFCNFGFMFFPHPEAAASSICRVLKPGGKALISTFTHVGYWTAVERAAKIVRPDGPDFQPPFPMVWTRPGHLPGIMRGAGFEGIESQLVECKMILPSTRELAANTARRVHGIFQGQGWTEAELSKLPDLLEAELSKDGDDISVEKDRVEVKMEANVVVCMKMLN